MSNDNTSKAKVWFVTGASAGIGAALVKSALLAGDRVVATARNLEKLRSAIGQPASDRLAFVPLDVTSEQQANQAVAAAVEKFGRIDVLVNNAGYSLIGNLESLTTEQVELQFETNFYGVLHTMRAALPVMRRQGSGRIHQLFLDGRRYRLRDDRCLCRDEVCRRGPIAV